MTMKHMITRKQVYYWASTGAAAVALTAIGVADVVRVPAVVQGLTHLGYPAYVATMLGVAKLLAVAAIVTPGHGRVKEWAYAGLSFVLTGAAISHTVSGDPVGNILVPVVLLAVVMASWAQAPIADRRHAHSGVRHAA